MEQMNITSAKYLELEGNKSSIEATIDGVVMSVPLDPANRHYAALLEWAAKDGNTIEEAD
jgi:hypothetical protein